MCLSGCTHLQGTAADLATTAMDVGASDHTSKEVDVPQPAISSRPTAISGDSITDHVRLKALPPSAIGAIK